MKFVKVWIVIIIMVFIGGCIGENTDKSSPSFISHTQTSSLTISSRVTADVNPPAIEDFNWTPTKIVWDKIYNIEVNFTVKDDKTPVKYAELHFIPVEYKYFITKYGMRPEDYPKVFPPEKERVYELKPVDGVFDELKEEFSVEIKNITGGREYRIIITAEDEAGNTQKFEYKTPYIRQYENFGRQLYEKGIIIGTPYYLWYRKDLSNWNDGHKYTPLLGTYRSDDPVVMSKHIDWVTGYGINLFMISWNGYESGDLKFFDDNLKLLLRNPVSNNIKIAIIYESPGRLKTTNNPEAPWEKNLSEPSNLKILLSDFEYLSKNYFQRENYFKIGDKPFVYVYDSAAFVGDVKRAIKELRETVEKTGYGVYLVSDHVHPCVLPGTNEVWEERARQFDGITCWLGGYSGKGEYLGGSYEKQLKILYSAWGEWAKENNKDLIPFTTPEFDGRYVTWGDPNSIPLERSTIKFLERLNIIFHYSPRTKIVMIGTFNDFFESTTLEPTREYGFTTLQVIQEVLEEYMEKQEKD